MARVGCADFGSYIAFLSLLRSAAAEKWAKEAIEAEDMDESDEEEGGTAP